MTPIVFLLVLIGVSYTSNLLTSFIVWLDGADEMDDGNEAFEPRSASEVSDSQRLDAA